MAPFSVARTFMLSLSLDVMITAIVRLKKVPAFDILVISGLRGRLPVYGAVVVVGATPQLV
jgi:hypothetical protein